MDGKIIFASALLAFTGATLSQAIAATPYVNPAYRNAAAYRAPVARMPQARTTWARTSLVQARSFRAPARMAWRLPYRPALAATPIARPAYGYRRLAQPAYGRVGYGYRVASPIARPAFNRFARGYRFAYRGVARPAYRRFAYGGYNTVARPGVTTPTVTMSSPALALGVPARVLPAPAVRRVAVAPTVVAPRIAAVPAIGGQVGRASYYSGGRTASGGVVGGSSCAHRSLPFGTRVLVTNMANARSTVCVVNDRGPFIGGRVVDLSRGAAGAIGMLGAGVAPVRIQVVGRS